MSQEREERLGWDDEKIEDPAHFLLYRGMRGIFEAEEMVEGDRLYIPEWELTIRPHVARWSEQSVMLQFQLRSSKWDRDISGDALLGSAEGGNRETGWQSEALLR